jgi:hypothetical protein
LSCVDQALQQRPCHGSPISDLAQIAAGRGASPGTRRP